MSEPIEDVPDFQRGRYYSDTNRVIDNSAPTTASKAASLRADLLASRAIMQTYLQLKVDEEDFHGVADAAMDLRDIDSALLVLKDLGL